MPPPPDLNGNMYSRVRSELRVFEPVRAQKDVRLPVAAVVLADIHADLGCVYATATDHFIMARATTVASPDRP